MQKISEIIKDSSKISLIVSKHLEQVENLENFWKNEIENMKKKQVKKKDLFI